MKINRQSDILINVFFPLLAGYMVYVADFFSTSLQVIRNYFPDGLWAYSFLSAILITWNRQINYAWIILIFLLTTGFEFLQYKQVVEGTGDWFDLICYTLFFVLAITTNRFFKNQYSNTFKPH